MGTAVEPEIVELTPEQGRAMLARVSARFGVSLNEFFRRLDAGEYDQAEDRDVLALIALAPFAR